MRRILIASLTASLSLSACSDRDLPGRYRRLDVPAGRLASVDVQRQGRAIFLERCALCHGAFADGRGIRRRDLPTRARDLTDVEWQRRTSDRRLFFVISEGLHGTAMPAWKGTLVAGEIWSVVAYLRILGPQPGAEADEAPRGPSPRPA